MAKKKVQKKVKKVAHRHFRPSYDAHPIFHVGVGLFILTLIFAILSVWMFTTFS